MASSTTTDVIRTCRRVQLGVLAFEVALAATVVAVPALAEWLKRADLLLQLLFGLILSAPFVVVGSISLYVGTLRCVHCGERCFRRANILVRLPSRCDSCGEELRGDN